MSTTTIYFDLECGGLQDYHPTIQLAAIAVNDSTWSEQAVFEEKIKFDPKDADPEALKLNHYSPEAWANAVDPMIVAERFVTWARSYFCIEMTSKAKQTRFYVGKLAGHNALLFDLPRLRRLLLLKNTFFPFSYHVKDTLQRALWFFDEHPELKRPANLKIGTLCDSFGIKPDGAHDALVDVRLTIALARKFSEYGRTRGQSVQGDYDNAA